MADNTKLQYIVELLTQGDTKKATEELNKLNKAGKDSANSVNLLQQSFTKLIALAGGMQFVHQSIDAFLEQERAIAKVNAALKATGEFTPQLSEEFQKLAEAMAQTSLYADEAILNVIAKLTAAGAKKGDIERLTRAVLDLSTLMDKDLNRATQAFAQALNGETAALKQAGIQIDETKTATERLNEALTAIEKKAGGQSAESVKTLGGQFEMLKKNVGEVKEALGGLILDALDPMIKRLTEVAKLVADFSSQNRKQISSGVGIASKAFNLASGLGLPGLVSDIIGGPGKARNPIADLGPEATATLQNFFGATGTALPKPKVTTPGMDAEDLKQRQKEATEYLADQLKAQLELEAAEQKRNAEELRMEEDQLEAFRRGEEIKQQLADETLLMRLEGEDRVRAQIEIDHEERLRQIGATRFATSEQYEEAIAAEQKLHDATSKRFEDSLTFNGRMKEDLKEVGRAGEQAFSQGLAAAIVDAFEEGDKAFQKFASNFLRLISQMILQTIILNTLKSIGGGFFAGGGQATAMAAGGVRYAADGLAGVNSVNGATYFPKFNVVAGEAGREVMTVLAKPRLERINGVPAQVGYAGNNRLAITSADALAGAGGGAGGRIEFVVRLSPEVKAELIENSVKQSRIVMVQDMATDTPLSRVTRQRVS